MDKTPLEKRKLREIIEHYKIEKELSTKLKNSSREERIHLYPTLYDELYNRVPSHPQIVLKNNYKSRMNKERRNLNIIKNFLGNYYSFLEVGAGDCRFSFEVAKLVKFVYAVDVSKVITEETMIPSNFLLKISNGIDIPIPPNSINVAYSNQLIEHLHPDDVIEHFKNIYKILKPRGIYFCLTPNRFNGPHDISKYFDEIATGFHLKEYTVTEISFLLKEIGYSKIFEILYLKRFILLLPVFLIKKIEFLLKRLPSSLAKKISKSPLKLLLGIALFLVK